VQVQVYLKLLALEEAELIEQFNGATHTENIKYNEEYFNCVIFPKLLLFSKNFMNILSDPVHRQHYILSRQISSKTDK
jgi:hypothetical protein